MPGCSRSICGRHASRTTETGTCQLIFVELDNDGNPSANQPVCNNVPSTVPRPRWGQPQTQPETTACYADSPVPSNTLQARSTGVLSATKSIPVNMGRPETAMHADGAHVSRATATACASPVDHDQPSCELVFDDGDADWQADQRDRCDSFVTSELLKTHILKAGSQDTLNGEAKLQSRMQMQSCLGCNDQAISTSMATPQISKHKPRQCLALQPAYELVFDCDA